jgi:MFS family permease
VNLTPLAHELRLLRQSSFRLLFLSGLGSGAGTWLAFVALTVDVYDRTHSSSWVSVLLIADFLPAVVLGLVAGPLIDRLPRRGLVVGADLVRCGVFCLLPFAGSAAVIVVLAAVAGAATGLFRPAMYAGLPNVVSEEDLVDANALLQTVENVTWALFPIVGGVIVAASGPALAYWINAGTFLVSAILLLQLTASALQEGPRQPSRGHWRDLAAGFSTVVRTRALVTVLVTWSIAMLASAGVNVAEISLAKNSLGSGDAGFGLLVGWSGLGLALGSLVAGPLIGRFEVARVYGAVIAVMAAGIAVAAAAPGIWVAAAAVLVAGIGNGAAVVCNVLLVQRGADDRFRGRAFTVIMSANFLCLGVGMAVAGPLTGAYGARAVWGVAAGIAGTAALVGTVLVRGVPRSAPAEKPVLARAV